LEQDFIKVILTKDQGKSKGDKEEVRIRKSRYIELDGTHCYIEKFNTALSLYGVLEVALYFSKSFLKAAAEESVVAEALWSLGVTIVYFLEQESNLWLPTPQ